MLQREKVQITVSAAMISATTRVTQVVVRVMRIVRRAT